jgi:hypothetical protein
MDSNGRDALPLTKQWSCGVLDGIEANEVPGDYPILLAYV